MKLTKKQFDVLLAYIEKQEDCTQRALARLLGVSVGSINKTCAELTGLGLLDKQGITGAGMQSMEQYKVKRAIFLAAGFGSRLVPITLNTPKPLVRVNGTRLIDTLLDAVQSAGIEEVVIIRGYLGEQFDQLKYKYPNIRFVENPMYNESNNISSAYFVRDLFCGAYVLESDLLLKNPKLIRKYEYSTNFLGIPVERTDDWYFRAENGIIYEQGVGGTNCYQMVGISYWDEQAGKNLEKDLEEVFNSPGGKERYWEQTALLYKKENYKIAVRECTASDIVEIDTFTELKQIDKIYDV
ncbi:MAG: NTP transferase domain-containing protein [Clostridia bacterium]|nr:NTP transferase domain-containing protein [Clostridia bacterium]